MPTYLVESYTPRSGAADACAAGQRAKTAAQDLSHEGTHVRHIRTTFLPDDETCFHFFEAVSAAAVEEVTRRAKLGWTRVVRAVDASRPA